MDALDHTHDPAARSWLDAANGGGDFPLQNLPFAVFRRRHGPDHAEAWRGGVAIGDRIVDLAALACTALLDGLALEGARAAGAPTLNALMALGPQVWRALRHALFERLVSTAPPEAIDALQPCLVPQAEAEYTLPAAIGDYTDFFTSYDHALNCARIAAPQAEVAPNFRWLPIGYHGRASTVGVSGQRFHRPWGQNKMPWEAPPPQFRPTQWLDYELELAVWVGPGNAQGAPVPLARAEQHVFGLGLLNDWSARDTQIWEMAPLGPFLAKDFATTVSPWVVTLDALAPFRRPWPRGAAEPAPLAYLEHAHNRAAGAFDIGLEVWLETGRSRREGTGAMRLSRTSFRHQYWTVAQMLAHHSSGGCMLRPGDLLGSGTVSGPTPQEAGSLLELSRGGQAPLALPNGERRAFLADGDAVILRGACEAPGRVRIGFGECRGLVLPAIAWPAGEAPQGAPDA